MKEFERENELTEKVIGLAMKVHSALGSGLLESAYEACLKYELAKHKIPFESQVMQPLHYDGVKIDAGYRLDVLVGNAVILELKAIEKILPVHQAQLLTYLKLSGKRVGLLINFNVEHLKDGIKRMVL